MAPSVQLPCSSNELLYIMPSDCHHVIIVLEQVPFLELSLKTGEVSTARVTDHGKVSTGSFAGALYFHRYPYRVVQTIMK